MNTKFYKENEQTKSDINKFVNDHVLANQTNLIKSLPESQFFDEYCIKNEYDYIDFETDELIEINADTDIEELEEGIGDKYDVIYKEILQWWLIDDYLADCLDNKKQPILKSEYGTWWGRTTAGQKICQDHAIEEIYNETQKRSN